MSQPASGRTRLSLLLDGLSLLVLCGAIGVYFTSRRSPAQASEPAPAGLHDSAFAELRVLDRVGRKSVLAPEPGSRGLLLFVFKSDCPACGIQKAEWIRLARLARERNVAVAGVTLEALSPAVLGYFAAPGISLFRIADPGAALPVLQTSLVPATILITDRRRIVFHGMGVLDPSRTRLLEGLL
jgi:hypothetical protein